MAKVDIKMGTALVPIYDGNPDHLNSFVDAVALFNDTVTTEFAEATAAQKAAAQNTMLRFVKTRITGAARQAAPENVDLAGLLAAIKESCAAKTTADNVLAKLKNMKQTASAESLCAEVEKLSTSLKAIYLRDRIPHEVASKMVTKSGVEALINGVKSSEAKLILKAGNFSKLDDAIQKVLENETTVMAPNAQIFWTERGNRSRGRGNFRGTRGRGTFNARRYDSQNYQRNGQTRFNRGNWNPRSNPNPRSNWNQRGHFRPNMFVAHQHPNFQQQIQQQPIQQQDFQQQLLHQNQQFINNNHPLGVPFRQHTQ